MSRKALAMAATLLAGVAALPAARAAEAPDPATLLDAMKSTVLSKGPNGEAAVSAETVSLTPEEVAKVKAMHATAAISLQYTSTEWARAQIKGITDQLAEYGIPVIAVTDAGFKAETQVSQIETLLARKPSIIISIPVDPDATADVFRQAAAQGVKLVFMDNIPKGFVAGKDYVSDVSADNYGNGVVSGLLMAKALGGKGTIGLIYHAADFFVTRQRYDGFKDTIAKFPDIKIVAEQGVAGPDFTGDSEKAASAMLVANRGLKGIWAVWDVPGEGVIAAARTAGLTGADLAMTTCDLGANIAIDMAQDGYTKGTGSQWPIAQARTEAKLAAYGLLGKPAPAYVALPAVPVTKDNILEAWTQVHGVEAPALVKQASK